jgi:hypothetical protein
MRTLALVLGLVFALPAAAQSRGPVAVAPNVDMQCVSVPISVVPMSTVRATDVGNGNVDLDIFVLSSTATPTVDVTRAGRTIELTLHAPEGMMSCTLHARLTGVATGSFDVRLFGRHPRIELARTSVAVR